MGKSKQAQRTKNNARPSSSSRSAEMLGTSMSNFVGFSAVKDGGYIPILPGLALSSSTSIQVNTLDTNFQTLLKKMNKKDATTKYKALQKFAALCEESELTLVEGILPFWPKYYCSLAIDSEHRVREAAQVAHGVVAKRVGRGIAMYLKQLAGPWFTSQFDAYPPAASAASNSFVATFPKAKVVDAVVHCQKEILTYICDNLTVHTPQSLSIQKSLSTEEMESRYQKILTSNLQGYSSYFNTVPAHEMEKVQDIHNKILSSTKFWKLARHESLPIKTAFFGVLSSMVINAENVIDDQKKKILTAIINNMDEAEPGILSAVWESLLVAVNKIQDWHVIVSIEKLVLPKLWRILRNGGQSCASVIYPNLLPFICQFSKLNLDIDKLYTDFFDNMRQGFSAKSLTFNKSEINAVIVSFIECLRYSVLTNSTNVDLCNKLLKEQLMPVVEMCLTQNSPLKFAVFSEVAHLVRYWDKNQDNEEYKSYKDLMQAFWSELEKIFVKIIDLSNENISSTVSEMQNSQIEFLLSLKKKPLPSRKNLKVKFSDSDESENVSCQIETQHADIDVKFLAKLYQFVNTHCTSIFARINGDEAQRNIKYLCKLMKTFDNEDLFITLSRASEGNGNLYKFYTAILQQWLLHKPEVTEYTVQLIFCLIRYMNDTDKDKVLESLTQIDDVKIVRNVIQCCLSKENRNDNILGKWTSQRKVQMMLGNITNEIVSGNNVDSNASENLILLAFETSENGDALITREAINLICFTLCNSIDQASKAGVTRITRLISSLVPMIWAHKEPTIGAVRLLETLLELSTKEYQNDSISIDAMREVWKKGLYEGSCKLPYSKFIELIKKFAAIIWQKTFNSNEMAVNDTLVKIVADFAQVIFDNIQEDRAKEMLLTFLTESEIKTWLTEATDIALYAEIVNGNVYVSELNQEIRICDNIVPINLTFAKSSMNIVKCLKWALFNTNLLTSLYKRTAENTDSQVEVNEINECKDIKLIGDTDIISNVLFATALGKLYSNYYRSTTYYSNVSTLLHLIKDSFNSLQKYLPKNVCSNVLQQLQAQYPAYGSISFHMINLCCAELQCHEDNTEYFSKYIENISRENDAYLQAIQILRRHLNWEEITVQAEMDDLSKFIVARSKLGGRYKGGIGEDVLEKAILLLKDDSLLSDNAKISWKLLTLPLETLRLITEIIKQSPQMLTSEHWDSIQISLGSWLQYLNKFKENYDNVEMTAIIATVCQLYCEFQSLMYKQELQPRHDLPPDLLDEWKCVFVDEVQSNVIRLWMFYSEIYSRKAFILKPIITLDCLGRAISLIDRKVFFKKQFAEASSATANVDEIITLSLKLLESTVPSIQLGGYHAMKHMISYLVKRDKVLVESENFDTAQLNIRRLEKVLLNTQGTVNIILKDFKLCDTVSCTIQPFTDSYTYTLGYLLTWAIILEMCSKAHGDLRYQYAEILKNDYVENFLNNIFKLMPVEIRQDKKKVPKLVDFFSTQPSLDFAENWTERRLDHIVCWLYTSVLRYLPVLVRHWWGSTDSRVSTVIDKMTCLYISPMLCQEELLDHKLTSIANLQVKVRLADRQVVALYRLDETTLEISIILPPNYPLGAVMVHQGQVAANLKNCQMQLSIFLTYQNGSICDGLELWRRNLDKKFVGVGECFICYGVFHISTYQLPNLTCRTCHNKFHSQCMYKWFNISQKSTCPICRNVF